VYITIELNNGTLAT